MTYLIFVRVKSNQLKLIIINIDLNLYRVGHEPALLYYSKFKKGCDVMEEIKKILTTISVNTLNSKPIRIKQNIFIGDSVKIPLLLTEGAELKQLHENCTVSILYSDLEGKEVRQQTENITIDTITSTLSFVPENGKLIVGVNKIQICIKDLDEQIYLPPLILNVLATTDSTVINNETNIQTLYELQKYIDLSLIHI